MRLRCPFCIITRYHNYSIYKMAAVQQIGYIKLKLKFLTAVYFIDMLCISLSNFMLIGHTVAEILRFFSFFSGEM